MILSRAYNNSSSEKEFYEKSEKLGIAFYRRNGVITGVKANRKYRLKTLGFSKERIQELAIHNNRLQSLEHGRSKKRDTGLER